MISGTGSWFAVRCVIRHDDVAYEERITLWQRGTHEAAISSAEQEAGEYAQAVDAEVLSFAQSFELFDGELADGLEVFSLARDSDLSPSKYLDRFFSTGTERQRSADE
jgi:hypothetical protein